MVCYASTSLCHSVEEQTLQDKMQADHHGDDFDMDAASHRLNEIYERMNEVRTDAPGLHYDSCSGRTAAQLAAAAVAVSASGCKR